MTGTITFRVDEDTRLALNELTADGSSTSSVVRDALIKAAARHSKARLHTEAKALASDPVDRAEMAQVLQDMETLRAW